MDSKTRKKSLSRQSLNLDRKQFAVLQSEGCRGLFLILKPKHKLKRHQLFDTLHSSASNSSPSKASNDLSIRKNTFIIGRRQDCSLTCDDPLVSGHHLKIVCFSQPSQNDQLKIWYELTDTSTNGLKLNGSFTEKGKCYKLRSGDIISLPASEESKTRLFSFIFRTPEKLSADREQFSKLFVDEGSQSCEEVEEKVEIESNSGNKLYNTQRENNFNSLNLRIINETQEKSRKRNFSAHSLKNIGYRTSLREEKPSSEKYNSLRSKFIQITATLAGSVYLANDKFKASNFQSSPLIQEKLDEIENNHGESEKDLLKLMQVMLDDFSASEATDRQKIGKWKDILGQVKAVFSQ